MPEQRELAALLARHAYQEGQFVLASGATSTFYLDAKQLTYHSAGVKLVGEAVLAIAREFNAESVGGLTMGADAIVVSTVYASQGTAKPLTGFIVRKEAKEHGRKKLVEGVDPKGKRVAIVEDVVTSGGSVLKAVDAAREAGAEVVVVIGLVDREQGGGDAIRKANVPFKAVCTLTEIQAATKHPAL